MSNRIKPCVYCGMTTDDHDPDTMRPAVEFFRHEDDGVITFTVSCNMCGGCGPLCVTGEEAIRLWNKPERKEVQP